MKKKIPTLCIVVLTFIFVFTISNMDNISSIANIAKGNEDVFLREVRKPDGSGYIFDSEDGINLSFDD